MLTIENARFKRTEHWDANDRYDGRDFVHLLSVEGQDIRVDATPEVVAQLTGVAALTTLRAVACSVVWANPQKGTVSLRADRVAVAKAGEQ